MSIWCLCTENNDCTIILVSSGYKGIWKVVVAVAANLLQAILYTRMRQVNHVPEIAYLIGGQMGLMIPPWWSLGASASLEVSLSFAQRDLRPFFCAIAEVEGNKRCLKKSKKFLWFSQTEQSLDLFRRDTTYSRPCA